MSWVFPIYIYALSITEGQSNTHFASLTSVEDAKVAQPVGLELGFRGWLLGCPAKTRLVRQLSFLWPGNSGLKT